MKQIKALLILTLGVFLTLPLFAARAPAEAKIQEHVFVFRLDQDFEGTRKPQKESAKFEYRTEAASYEIAFKKAAQACFQHFKDGRKLSEAEGLSIIDTCANPRGS